MSPFGKCEKPRGQTPTRLLIESSVYQRLRPPPPDRLP